MTVSLVAALAALLAFKVNDGTAIEALQAGAHLDTDTVTDIGEWQIAISEKLPDHEALAIALHPMASCQNEARKCPFRGPPQRFHLARA